jgi:hypothetical protein
VLQFPDTLNTGNWLALLLAAEDTFRLEQGANMEI